MLTNIVEPYFERRWSGPGGRWGYGTQALSDVFLRPVVRHNHRNDAAERSDIRAYVKRNLGQSFSLF